MSLIQINRKAFLKGLGIFGVISLCMPLLRRLMLGKEETKTDNVKFSLVRKEPKAVNFKKFNNSKILLG